MPTHHYTMRLKTNDAPDSPLITATVTLCLMGTTYSCRVSLPEGKEESAMVTELEKQAKNVPESIAEGLGHHRLFKGQEHVRKILPWLKARLISCGELIDLSTGRPAPPFEAVYSTLIQNPAAVTYFHYLNKKQEEGRNSSPDDALLAMAVRPI